MEIYLEGRNNFMSNCPNCQVGTLNPPKDQHPSYVQCNSCLAIQKTYIPQEYQETMHQVSTGNEIDIIAVFGGYG